jgi:hypothetical protein
MCPTIRIDDDVYRWLQGQAAPFDDTPNSVLRRIGGLDETDRPTTMETAAVGNRSPVHSKRYSGRRAPLATGDELKERWGIPVLQARFHIDGHYYEHLIRFPAALCDPKGYVIFKAEEDYQSCKSLRLGQQVNVEMPGISSIPGYHEVDDPLI